jgi:hypothetical protein
MARENPINHDHSNRGTGGKHLKPDKIGTDEVDYADRINRTYRLDPATSDAGDDINQLIADAGGDHIKIEVPGEARLPIGTQVDFSPGVNNQGQDQVVWLAGEGASFNDTSPNIGTDRGSLFVNDGLSSDMFVCNGARWALRLSDFAIADTPSGQFGINIGQASRASEFRNITIDGNDNGKGFSFNDCYGARFDSLAAQYCDGDPFRSDTNNAAHFSNIVVTRNGGSDPAFSDVATKGAVFEGLYIESNRAMGIDLDATEATTVDAYVEANNTGGVDTEDVLIRGSGQNLTFSGYINSNNVDRSIYALGSTGVVKFDNVTVNTDTNILCSAGGGGVFVACDLFDLNTSNAGSGSTLINTDIRGTWTDQPADARLPQDV